jgi:hypothetical protein
MENSAANASEESPLAAVVVLPADGPTDAETPGISPAPVEPVSGDLVVEPKRRGRPPASAGLRVQLIEDFVSGKISWSSDKRLRFLKDANLTPAEKAHFLRHEKFKQLYDARIFDMFVGLEEPTKENLKLIHLVGLRIGLAKPISMNVKNMQMASKGPVSIEVEK